MRTVIKKYSPIQCIILLFTQFILLSVNPVNSFAWQPLFDNSMPYTTEHLYAITFANESIGYAVGDMGVIIKTLDTGGTWALLQTGTTEDFRAIACSSDGQTCLALSNMGDVYRTVNGGDSWQSTAGIYGAVNDVSCDRWAQVCIAVADGGWVAKTINSGASWSHIQIGDEGWLEGISCSTDMSRCVVVGNEGLFLTTDGGVTWDLMSEESQGIYMDVACSDDGSACYSYSMEPGQAYILESKDGGNTWLFPYVIDNSGGFCCIFASSDGSRILAINSSQSVVSTDASETWSLHTRADPNVSYQDMDCASDSKCVAVGLEGAVYYTNDFGITWREDVNSGEYSFPYHGVDFRCPISIDTCMVLSSKVIKITGSGSSYEEYPYTAFGLKAMDCPVDTETCFFGGLDGIVLKTENGGTTFSYTSNEGFSTILDIHCPTDATICYQLTEGGRIHRTTDGGVSWNMLDVPYGYNFNDIHCPVDPLRCIAVGNRGRIYKTADGWETWTDTSPIFNTNYNLYSIVCQQDELNCVAVGSNGVGLRSSNGGNSWSQFDTGISIYSMFCHSTVCYAGASQEQFYQSTDGGQTWSLVFQGDQFYFSINNIECPNDAGHCLTFTTKYPWMHGNAFSDATGPSIVSSQANIDDWLDTNTTAFDVDVTDLGGAGLSQIQVRACTTNDNCGNSADWTIVRRRITGSSVVEDWAFPDSFWNRMKAGKNYISLRAFDNQGNVTTVGPLFSINKLSQAGGMLLSQGWNLIGISSYHVVYNFSQMPGSDGIQIHSRTGEALASDQDISLTAGTGYWLYNPDQIGYFNPVGEDIDVLDFTIYLSQGWSAIANPFNKEVPYDDAHALLQCDAGTLPLPALYQYVNNNYEAIEPQSGDMLEPWKGYWIKANIGCTLRISNPQ